jgi:hypothetical protein
MGCSWLVWDGVFVFSLVGWIIPLIGRGFIPPALGFSALIGLILLRAVARMSRGGRLSRPIALTYDLGVPVAAFSTLLITLSGANLDQIVQIWLF